jgi:hypothetical protein
MNARLWRMCLIASLLFILSPFAQAQANLPVPVPAGQRWARINTRKINQRWS